MQGSRVGPYLLLAEIGSGGMGTVYLAHDEEEDRPVAVKVLHARLSDRDGFFRRFQREAEAGMRVEDDHVVRTLDFGLHVADGRTLCYLVTEFVEGRTLRALLAELGSVPEALVREIARQVASGLAAIHAAGVVHRDVKPDNVLITEDQRVRIMDLGVAKVLDATQALTGEGQFAGSLAYAAPEQFGVHRAAGATEATPRSAEGAKGGSIDPRADLYSLGVMLHELVTGKNPLARETSAATVRAQLEEVPPDLAEVAPDVSPVFAELVATLLAKRVDARPASATAVLEVLGEGERSAWWADRREDRQRRTSAIPRVPVRRVTALHGREGDLALLADLWEKAKAGSGSTLLVEGEAGIGKSRLVDAFLGTLGAGTQALYGSYAPSGGLGGLYEAVVQRFGAARLEAALAPCLAATPALVPAFAALLRDEPPPAGAASLQGDALHAVFVHLLRGLAAERPLVWVVEDLHFASQEARRIVLSLARAAAGHRALVVLTSRPPVPERELAALSAVGSFRRTQLARLGADDVAQLLRDAFRSERLVEKLAPRITEKSDGVPFFVFETIQGLKAGQFVTELPDGTWVESKVIDRIEVPSAVRDLIGVRLSRVPTEVREVLDVASAQGFEFDPDIAAAALGRPPLSVLQALARLERRSGVVRAVDRRYRFDHHQIQEVVYADLAPRLREEYHAAIAEALERRACAAEKDPAGLDGALCVDLAEHFLQGARGARALRYVEAALTHLEGSYVNERAVALAERALAAPGLLAGGERCVALLCRARCQDLLGRVGEQVASIREALALAQASGDPTLIVRAMIPLGWHLTVTSNFAEARQVLEEAVALAPSARDRQCEEGATGNLANVYYHLGLFDEARARFERQLEIAREIGFRRGEANATGSLGNVCLQARRFAEARAHYERYCGIAREIGFRRGEANAVGNLGNVFVCLGRFGDATAQFERHLALAREIGLRHGESVALGNLGHCRTVLGQPERARELLDESRAICRSIGLRGDETFVLERLADVASELGDFAEAERLFREALAVRDELLERSGGAGAIVSLGVALVRMQRIDEARGVLSDAARAARETGDRAACALVACHLASLPGGDPLAAGAELAAHEPELAPTERMEAHLLLWQATHDRTHLAEAKRLLDFMVEHAPPECREPMLTNVRLHREIAAAVKEAGL